MYEISVVQPDEKSVEKVQYARVQFRYDERIIADIKTIPGRKWDANARAWLIPLLPESEEALNTFLTKWKGYDPDRELAEYLSFAEGSLSEPSLPTSWNHYKKEYAAILTLVDGKNNRIFLGRKTNYTSSGANAHIEYCDDEMPDALPVGAILEIRDGSHKHCDISYYRKDIDGWKYIATREGVSGFFGGGKESMKSLLRNQKYNSNPKIAG